MIELIDRPQWLIDGRPCDCCAVKDAGREGTLAYKILTAHNKDGERENMRIRFDGLISHDITYVGIIQTARAGGLERFPVPYAMTNCHNSLCAVGGTINEDDHVFGLSAAHKYGGIYVPANQAVIHQYAREEMSGCGRMILGSDSHTRYGALGTMGFGEGGPELVKQILKNTYDIAAPKVVMVYVTGAPKKGVGPHDVALALCAATYKNGFVKNKVLEFVGPGIAALPMDFRIGIDVMTTETACLSSIWQTDDKVKEYYGAHGRPEAYQDMTPDNGARYDSCIHIDLSRVEPMIALPFHPSNAYTIHDFLANAGDLLRQAEKEAEKLGAKDAGALTGKLKNGVVTVDQGIIAGCSGGMFDNIWEAADILEGGSVGCGAFSLSVYPPSMPVQMELLSSGVQQRLISAGALFKPCFCGPCFGAGDVPANGALSIRHTTRNFPNREGSKPGEGQISYVALMDARSIAATARNQGRLTAATDVDYASTPTPERTFDTGIYGKRVYNGWGRPEPDAQLVYGPGIADWPAIQPLSEHLMLELTAVLRDAVTTTDELIPSGETSSYRSNPMRLAKFALSRREPAYVGRCERVRAAEAERLNGQAPEALRALLKQVGDGDELIKNTQLVSCVFANKPGDGSAREQAASCQRVLGGGANICYEYATKRYRSNLINWGIMPFTLAAGTEFPYEVGDHVFVPNIRQAVREGREDIPATVITGAGAYAITFKLANLTADEREILLDGCLINYYREKKA